MGRQRSVFPEPATTLEGARVRLEPLTFEHSGPLEALALQPALWTLTQKRIDSADTFAQWIGSAIAARAQGTEVPFAVIERKSGRPVGSTRYQNIDVGNRRLEIGWSWLGLPWQGSGMNTEMKYLMLRHAVDELGFARIEFKTNAPNTRSRAALRKLGAQEEGVFRQWRVDADGSAHDTAWYSILDAEWPAIKVQLEERISQPSNPKQRESSEVCLMRASEADVPFIMATERLAGYENLVGRWDELQHRAALADARYAYFVTRDGADPVGFVIVRDWASPEHVTLIKRIAVSRPGFGYGKRLLSEVVDTVFKETEAYRLWLGVYPENARARKAYEAVGFQAEGIARGSAFFGGAHRDELMMAILRSEWSGYRSN